MFHKIPGYTLACIAKWGIGQLSSPVLVAFLVFVFLAGVPNSSYSGGQDEQTRELQKVAFEIYDAIISKDAKTILKFIDRKAGIRWGPDGSKPYTAVKDDLGSRKGVLYCWLFGCPGIEAKSVREFFRKVDRSSLQVRVRPLEPSANDIQFAEVIYDWPGKPQDLFVQLPNPIFRLRGKRWMFESVFME